MMRSMNRSFLKLVLSLCLLVAGNLTAQTNTPDTSVWRNPKKPLGERVQALMSQLTLKEKISLLYWLAPPIDRLGIPEYHTGNECLHGLVRPGSFTVFPQAIGMAATFDPELIHGVASAISDEARAKWNVTGGKHLGLYSDVLTVWSPVVNMARDPRWGRTQETYGEDPWLTSRMGVAFVKGLQGDDPRYLKLISTPKHFAGNNEEHGRMGKNIICDERYLREYELFSFRACVKEGKAESIMASYTAINGIPSVANKWLLTDVLRKDWGFKGYVVSDCGAVSHVVDAFHYAATPEEAIAACLNAGLDMEGGYFAKYPDVVNKYLGNALQQGLVKQEVMDRALGRILTGRFRLGIYDPPDRVPYSKIPESVICSPEHITLARRVAEESMVLLRNEPFGGKPLLPINSSMVKRMAVVGPNANAVNLGDYSGSPKSSVSPLEGLRKRAASTGITIDFHPWESTNEEVVPSVSLLPQSGSTNQSGKETGLLGSYYDSTNCTGTPVSKRTDHRISFDWAHIEPDPLASSSNFGVVWEGKIHCSQPGFYTFSLAGDGGFSLKLDGREVISKLKENSSTRRSVSGRVHFDESGDHPVRIEYHHDGGETGLAFNWIPAPAPGDLSYLKNADLVVAVMGISTEWEIEGKDRKTLGLPPEQQSFLEKALKVNPRLVLVTESGTPLAMPWAATNIPSIVQAWYPGQEGGEAIADVLFGDYNPAGRLPLTFYADDSQLRPMQEYDITKGRTYMYLKEKPAYAFGHGLSYTTFKYSKFKLSKSEAHPGEQITLSVDVTNTGERDGDEVVQAYVHALKPSVPLPLKQLWAFRRVSIPKGETKTVNLDLETKNFGRWDKEKQLFIVEPGVYDVEVGSASDDIRGRGLLSLSND